jgi:nucleoside diphosphate kinase
MSKPVEGYSKNTPNYVSTFYLYIHLCIFSGPVYALGLAREDAIEGWRNMLGPKEVPKAKEEAPER